jgi:hypothetical protein
MQGRPIVIIAHTVKGNGLREAEFNYHWHTHAPSTSQADLFLADLNQRYARTERFSRKLIAPKDGGLEAVIKAGLVTAS